MPTFRNTPRGVQSGQYDDILSLDSHYGPAEASSLPQLRARRGVFSSMSSVSLHEGKNQRPVDKPYQGAFKAPV